MWIIASRRSEGGFSHGGSGLSGTAPFRDCSCNCSCRACSHSVWGIKELACHGIAISVWAPNLASPYLLGAANRRAHAIAQRIAIRVTRSSPSTSTRKNSLLMISTSSPPGRWIVQRPDDTGAFLLRHCLPLRWRSLCRSTRSRSSCASRTRFPVLEGMPFRLRRWPKISQPLVSENSDSRKVKNSAAACRDSQSGVQPVPKSSDPCNST